VGVGAYRGRCRAGLVVCILGRYEVEGLRPDLTASSPNAIILKVLCSIFLAHTSIYCSAALYLKVGAMLQLRNQAPLEPKENKIEVYGVNGKSLVPQLV